jgi:hypothetical protein
MLYNLILIFFSGPFWIHYLQRMSQCYIHRCHFRIVASIFQRSFAFLYRSTLFSSCFVRHPNGPQYSYFCPVIDHVGLLIVTISIDLSCSFGHLLISCRTLWLEAVIHLFELEPAIPFFNIVIIQWEVTLVQLPDYKIWLPHYRSYAGRWGKPTPARPPPLPSTNPDQRLLLL